MALPTVPLAPANTIKPVNMWAVITPDGASAVQVPVTGISPSISIGEVERLVPTGDYIMADRSVPTTREQSFICKSTDFVQAQRDLAFGASIIEGTCTLFVTDPADGVGNVKWKTNDFACTIFAESDADHNIEAFSEWSFRVKANEIVTETFDGVA